MNRLSAILIASALALVLALVSTASAAPGRPAKTKMPRSEIKQIVKFSPGVQKARAARKAAKTDMDKLTDNIVDNQRSGGDWVGQRGTQQAINNAINAHGRAVRNETQAVNRNVTNFIRTNNIQVIPEAPTSPPPPLPAGRAPRTQAALNTNAPAQLGVPGTPPPARRDPRPPGGGAAGAARISPY